MVGKRFLCGVEAQEGGLGEGERDGMAIGRDGEGGREVLRNWKREF